MKQNSWMYLAFLTATASAVYIIESLIMSMLPLPFIRIGLSNIVVLYLVFQRQIAAAFLVTIAKSVLGGVATFNLLSPMLPLSLGGGLFAVSVMSLGLLVRPRLSIFGISVLGAMAHNAAQIMIVRWLLIRSNALFVLTPFLILLALTSGIVTAYLCVYLKERIPSLKATI